MFVHYKAISAAPFFLTSVFAVAQDFPRWEEILQQNSSSTDDTPVPSMKMGLHMQMSLKATAQPGDEERATQIVTEAKKVLEKYADVNTALHDGYKPFFPSGKIGEEVHYTNYRYAQLERKNINYGQPGSILYKRTLKGMQAVGVMYTAPRDATSKELDAIAPLSVATWHRHIDFCGWSRATSLEERFGRNARFGPQGSIHTETECKDSKGLWIPVVLVWMTHVYPNATELDKVWGGMDMPMEAAGIPTTAQ